MVYTSDLESTLSRIKRCKDIICWNEYVGIDAPATGIKDPISDSVGVLFNISY